MNALTAIEIGLKDFAVHIGFGPVRTEAVKQVCNIEEE